MIQLVKYALQDEIVQRQMAQEFEAMNKDVITGTNSVDENRSYSVDEGNGGWRSCENAANVVATKLLDFEVKLHP